MAELADNVVTSREHMNRKVWVVNIMDTDYTEEFRGDVITVPGGQKKKVQMSYLKAERFLSQMPEFAPEQLPNGHWVHPPKSLKIVEMTDSERGGPAPKILDETKTSCTLCEFSSETESGLKRHFTVKHPERASEKAA